MTAGNHLLSFFEDYQDRNVGLHGSVPSDSLPKDGYVAQQQQSHLGRIDEHRIPVQEYEIRIDESSPPDDPTSEFVIADAVHTVESFWDDTVATHGLSPFVTYAPFHEFPNEFGIYVRQEGLRYLGHLLYDWSRVANVADGFGEQVRVLDEQRFVETNQLRFEPPAFDTRKEAIEFGLELLVRYHWFVHQLEILAAYVTDTTGQECWSEFASNYGCGVGTNATLVETLAAAHTARSVALRNYSPPGIGQDVFVYRALHDRFESPGQFRDSVESVEDLRKEVASELTATALNTSSGSILGILGSEFPFDWDPFAASPDRLPIYITRNEFDPNNGKYGSTIPLATNWEIIETDTWEDTYADATPEMQRAADDAHDKLKENVFHPGLKFKECRPDDRYYFRLNQEFRGIACVDNESERVDLIDFGRHDLPAEYGCYNT